MSQATVDFNFFGITADASATLPKEVLSDAVRIVGHR